MGLLQPDGRGRRLFRRDALTEQTPLIVVIHALPHAVAALSAAAEAGRPVTLLSAPEAGISTGPGWFGALVAAARAAVPAAECSMILHCGDDAGAAQAAIRAGIEGILFTGRVDVAERLADIASKDGIRLVTVRPDPALDLAAEFFASPETLRRRCAFLLASLPPV
jgi:acyl-CoA reductase-like NAD-dependent aldehyde dehydrogenase